MVFGLFSSHDPSTHPLATAKGVRKTLASYDVGDPLAFLQEANHALASIDGLAAELGDSAACASLRMLEDGSRAALRALLARFVDESGPLYLNELARAAIGAHADALVDGYVRFLLHRARHRPAPPTAELASAATRAIRAWALGMALRRLFYRLPDPQQWRTANDLVARASQAGIENMAVPMADGEASSSVLREYLLAVYAELAPTNNLMPAQMALIDRFLAAAGTLPMLAAPDRLSTHVIDLAGTGGPQRFDPTASAHRPLPGQRYFSVVDLHNRLNDLIRDSDGAQPSPTWLRDFPLDARRKLTTLAVTEHHWLPTPPQRHSDRACEQYDLMVVLGSELAQALLDINVKVRERALQAVHGPTEPGAPVPESSFELLYRMEAAIAGKAIETWHQIDHSETGLAATIPALLPRYRVGMTVAFRYADGLVWRAGIVRRIGRDPTNKPTLGVAFLPDGEH